MHTGLANAQRQFPKATVPMVCHEFCVGYYRRLRVQTILLFVKVAGSGAHLSVQKHGQGLAGAKPIPIAEVIHGVPTEGPILAPLQHQSVEEGQDKQQPWPCVGLLGAALGKHCGGQGAKAA